MARGEGGELPDRYAAELNQFRAEAETLVRAKP
jgi:hypothetical protein